MTDFFTADTHWGHANVIEYCDRPWPDVAAMNAGLIERWNSRVQPNDTVYHLGDFGFGKPAFLHTILDQLNGDITLIEGNHDRQNLKGGYIRDRFKAIHSYLELKVIEDDGFVRRVSMCHYESPTWRGKQKGHYRLYGHSHGGSLNEVMCPHCDHRVFPPSRKLDVGVDCHNYYPLAYAELKAQLDPVPY
jgi:calcineurin-like phosphoesterase family protein